MRKVTVYVLNDICRISLSPVQVLGRCKSGHIRFLRRVTNINSPMDKCFTGLESNLRPHEYEAVVPNTRPTFGVKRRINLRFYYGSPL